MRNKIVVLLFLLIAACGGDPAGPNVSLAGDWQGSANWHSPDGNFTGTTVFNVIVNARGNGSFTCCTSKFGMVSTTRDGDVYNVRLIPSYKTGDLGELRFRATYVSEGQITGTISGNIETLIYNEQSFVLVPR